MTANEEQLKVQFVAMLDGYEKDPKQKEEYQAFILKNRDILKSGSTKSFYEFVEKELEKRNYTI